MTQISSSDDSPEIVFHVRWVARIALLIGVATAVGLVLTLNFVTNATGSSYGALIEARSITQDRLGPALLLGGLVLSAFAAVITWLITLYSSFRIAGPLFRLSRNLEKSIRKGPTPPIPIRASDRLHQEAALLDECVIALESHYASLRQDVEGALAQLDAGGMSPEQRQTTLNALQSRLQHAKT